MSLKYSSLILIAGILLTILGTVLKLTNPGIEWPLLISVIGVLMTLFGIVFVFSRNPSRKK